MALVRGRGRIDITDGSIPPIEIAPVHEIGITPPGVSIGAGCDSTPLWIKIGNPSYSSYEFSGSPWDRHAPKSHAVARRRPLMTQLSGRTRVKR